MIVIKSFLKKRTRLWTTAKTLKAWTNVLSWPACWCFPQLCVPNTDRTCTEKVIIFKNTQKLSENYAEIMTIFWITKNSTAWWNNICPGILFGILHIDRIIVKNKDMWCIRLGHRFSIDVFRVRIEPIPNDENAWDTCFSGKTGCKKKKCQVYRCLW